MLFEAPCLTILGDFQEGVMMYMHDAHHMMLDNCLADTAIQLNGTGHCRSDLFVKDSI